jgi:hypothetical protein
MFWVFPMALMPKTALDALVLFRPGGDQGYLPPVAAAADLKLGEISVKEYAGTGVRSFPLAPFVVHGFLERLLGSAGFMLADILVIFLYACALRYLLISQDWLPAHGGSAGRHVDCVCARQRAFGVPTVARHR